MPKVSSGRLDVGLDTWFSSISGLPRRTLEWIVPAWVRDGDIILSLESHIELGS